MSRLSVDGPLQAAILRRIEIRTTMPMINRASAEPTTVPILIPILARALSAVSSEEEDEVSDFSESSAVGNEDGDEVLVRASTAGTVSVV